MLEKLGISKKVKKIEKNKSSQNEAAYRAKCWHASGDYF